MTSWLARLGGRGALARVALNLVPRGTPYGGGNQFVLQLARALRGLGFDVIHDLGRAVDVVLMVEARDELASFAVSDVARWREHRPVGIVIHRVNECDERKGTSTMDAQLSRVNSLADHTVFISAWLRDYHAARWFDSTRPNSVVRSGADPRVFHPLGGRLPSPAEPFRLATHHWSDHPRKGFAIYSEIDAAIADGRLPGFELMVVGRWPASLRWRSARSFEPAVGERLADLLRSAHGYVTASLSEPGGMHVAEALQCGLPVAYHLDGGGLVEQASTAGVGFTDDVVAAVVALRNDHARLRRAALEQAPSGELMCLEYVRLLHRLLAERGPPG